MNEDKSLDVVMGPGSHNGRELELMLRGIKPLAMFVAEDSVPSQVVGDAEFEPYVREGRIIKFVYRNDKLGFERRCYCLPTEEWRGKLSNFIFQQSCEHDLRSIFSSTDRARIDGFLLGYAKDATEEHVRQVAEHFSDWK